MFESTYLIDVIQAKSATLHAIIHSWVGLQTHPPYTLVHPCSIARFAHPLDVGPRLQQKGVEAKEMGPS